jgi:hypothetical protein
MATGEDELGVDSGDQAGGSSSASPHTPHAHGLRFDACGGWVVMPAHVHVEASGVGAPRSPQTACIVDSGCGSGRLEVENQLAFAAMCSRFELNLLEFDNTFVDWDTLQIDDKLDDEGILDFESEKQKQINELFILKKQDDNEKQERKGGANSCSVQNNCHDKCAAILIFQHLRGEMKMFDRNSLVMEPDNVYPNMKEFWPAMRQYIIDNEFELGIEATDKMIYIDYCRGEDCPWSINVRVEHK